MRSEGEAEIINIAHIHWCIEGGGQGGLAPPLKLAKV